MSLSTPPQTPMRQLHDSPLSIAPLPTPTPTPVLLQTASSSSSSSTPPKTALYHLTPPVSPPSDFPPSVDLTLSPPPIQAQKEHPPPPLGLGLPLPRPSLPFKLSKRHRRLTLLLVSSSFLLLLLSSIVLSSPSASAVLTLPASLFSSSSTPSRPVTVTVRPGKTSPKRPSRPAPTLSTSPLVLTPPQELAALINHLSSLLDSNSLPPTLDPNKPLNPDLVLGFDTRGPDAHTVQARVEEMVLDTWAQNPVVLFTRSSPRSREVVQLLESYALQPQPLIVDLSQRADARVLLRLLGRLTTPGHPVGAGEVSLPLLIVGGQAVHATVKNLHDAGELASMFERAGATVGAVGMRSGGRNKRRWGR